MANVKISALTEDTTPTSDDLIATVNDPGGTPASRKATLANAITKAHGIADGGVLTVSSGIMAKTTAPTVTSVTADDVITTDVQAQGSSGVIIKNTSGVAQAEFGSGGGTNASINGSTNMGTASADYHQLAGGTGTITDTATGSSTNINVNIVPKGTGRLQAGGVNVPTVSSSDTLTNKTLTSPVINVGSDADGDMYYRSSGAFTRLPKGSASQVLTMNAGATAPEWAAASGGGSASIYAKFDLYAGTPDATATPTSMQVVYGNTGASASHAYGARGWTMQSGSTATGVAWGYFGMGSTASEFQKVFDRSPRCFFSVSFFADNSPANRIWFGIGANHASTPSDDGTTRKVVGFRLDRTGSASTLYAVVGNGTSETATNVTSSVTDLAVGSSNKTYLLWFDMTSGTNVKFYWGATLLTTISTNLPSGSPTTAEQSVGAFVYNNSTASPASNFVYFRNAYMELKVA